MRSWRRLLTLCLLKPGVVMLLFLSAPMLVAQAPASDADARLRQLLEQKIRELDGTGKQRPTPPAAGAARPSAPASAAVTNRDAAARQLLEQKIKELNAQPALSEQAGKEQDQVRRRAEKEAQQRAIEDAKRRAHDEAQRKDEKDRAADGSIKAAAPSSQEAERVAREKAIAEQKAREEKERQDRINKIKADLAGQNAPRSATTSPPITAPPAAAAPSPAVAPAAANADAARRLLEQKTRDLDASTAPVVAPGTRASPRAPTPAVVTSGTASPAAATSADSDQTLDRARLLLEQRTRALGGAPAPETTPASPHSASQPSKSGHAVAPVVPPSAPAVQSPLPQTKQEKLAQLLEAYRANLITPADYHAARAKILAEP